MPLHKCLAGHPLQLLVGVVMRWEEVNKDYQKRWLRITNMQSVHVAPSTSCLLPFGF